MDEASKTTPFSLIKDFETLDIFKQNQALNQILYDQSNEKDTRHNFKLLLKVLMQI